MNSVRAVDRAIDILEAMSVAPEGMKISELEEVTGISRPTLYRLVATLVNRNLLRQCGDPTRYEMDAGIIGLAQPWMKSAGSFAHAAPALDALAVAAGETVGLCLRRGAQRIFVREITSPHPLKYAIGVGATEPLLRGAGGRAILAFLDGDEVAAVLAETGDVLNQDLDDALREIRAYGYALSESQILEGATAIAAPIFGQDGRCLGSVGVYGPSVRLSGDRIPAVVDALLACADRISVHRPE